MKSKTVNEEDIINSFRRGDIIIFPTDTSFGIGCIISNTGSIKRLYKIKGRPKGKPSTILVSNIEMAREYTILDNRALLLVERFWPGPLTLVLSSGNLAPNFIKGEGGTLGIREPDHDLLKTIIDKVGEPILGPSANFSGDNPPYNLSTIDKKLIGMVDYVIEEKCGGQQNSTIIDLTNNKMSLVRKGPIDIKDLKGVLRSVSSIN